MSLVACGDVSQDAAVETEASPAGENREYAAPDAVPSQAEDTARPEAAEPESVALALEGEGLRVFTVATGAARPIPFGTPADATISAITAVEGAPPRDQGENVDCRAAYADWSSGLTTWFSDGDFVGWSVHTDGATLTTASGVGLGSTRAELESSYDARMAESSIGIEFTAGGLAGLLDSAAPDARVVGLWAGHTCIAR